MKAQKLIELAFYDIGQGAAEQPLTPAMGQNAISSLNLYMFQHAHLGLGYTEIETSGDDITTPSWSWRWMRYSLALELSPQYASTIQNIAQLRALRNEAYADVCQASIDPYWVDVDDALVTEQNTFIVAE